MGADTITIIGLLMTQTGLLTGIFFKMGGLDQRVKHLETQFNKRSISV